ncbi:MAG: hypothetical protein ABIR63_02625 [Sphingomicrobium sp.]
MIETSGDALRSSGMKRFRLPLLAGAMLLSIAACDRGGPVANDVEGVTPAAITTATSTGAVPGSPPPIARDADPNGAIPAALQGRWGLSPADCITSRGDNKGMLQVTAEQLMFFESRATPGTSIERRDTGISGNFDFTGEGQRWSKYVSLTLQNGRLVETERSPATSYTYARCN